jgi:hypothetical protein
MTESGSQSITQHELEQCQRANAAGRQPVVFVHGLWLLPSSWDRWAALFEENGFAALEPGWPDDPDTVEEAKELYETYAVPTAGKPLFQAATANFNPWTEAKVDTKSPGRGHALTIDSGWREVADKALAFVKRFV